MGAAASVEAVEAWNSGRVVEEAKSRGCGEHVLSSIIEYEVEGKDLLEFKKNDLARLGQ